MRKSILSIILFTSLFVEGQNRTARTQPKAEFGSDIIFDNSPNDLSTLDQFYLISKTINPNAAIVPNKDTLLIQFDLPPWVKLSDSLLLVYAKTYFDALSIFLTKNSVTFKWIAIQVCNDPLHCVTAWYEVKSLIYKDFSLTEKTQYFLQANFHPNLPSEEEKSTGKHALVLRYFIGNADIYSRYNYIRSYNQMVCTILAYMLQKSPKKIREKYDEIITLYWDSQYHLQYFWRMPLNNEQLSRLFKISWYESNLKIKNSQK